VLPLNYYSTTVIEQNCLKKTQRRMALSNPVNPKNHTNKFLKKPPSLELGYYRAMIIEIVFSYFSISLLELQ
jgi:hypothetical protein